ncbi:MAG: LamG domain-containing protein, partial [Candidatus Methylomirabilis sp.]|nr:LamG domain-containing protein [Deltaproteobacteria bacterium]
VEVRVGGGRQVGRASAPDMPAGWLGNTNVLDSIENLFNYHAYMKPVTPNDIVWILGNGRGTDEFSFDDYLNPDSFILSNMLASVSWTPVAAQIRNPWHHNGFQLLPFADFIEDIHLQNGASATPDRWRTPAYGKVQAGTGRAEQVALGGMHGRGFWLTGGNRIEYRIPAQPRNIRDADWFVAIFVDPRFEDDGATRELVAFPDGSALRLRGRSAALFVGKSGEVVRETALPAAMPKAGWTHLGVNLRNESRDLELFVDGFLYDRFSVDEPVFEMAEGRLYLGDAPGGAEGFRGWIDEFKVFARSAAPEIACNHALGTLVGVEDNARWAEVAARYPDWAHQKATDLLAFAGEPTYARYACYHEYTRDYGAHLGNIPQGTRSVRKGLNFPESQLRFGHARPDSSGNAFCLTCHASGAPFGLSTAALTFNPGVNVEDDPR